MSPPKSPPTVKRAAAGRPDRAAPASAQPSDLLPLLLEAAQAWGSEVSLDRLMGRIVEQATRILNCERSSVFLIDRPRGELYSLVAQGLEAREIRIPLSSGLAGHVARSGEVLEISDAYRDPRFNPEVDRGSGFRTRSVLGVPLRNRKGEILGVLQCLNRKDAKGQNDSFQASDRATLLALASLAALFLESALLYRELDRLLESMVGAISQAIDDRDPCTSGHSRRVSAYALNLARAVHESERPPFDQIRYTRERLQQFRYATLLHDVGKIGVREAILCKAARLPPGMRELIEGRWELLRERKRSETLARALREQAAPDPLLAREFTPFSEEVDRALALILAANTSGRVSDQEAAALAALKEKGWLTALEFEYLSVRQGNLTSAEWADMRSHVTKSFELLARIPWPQDLSEVPEVAFTHHEKRDGSGYPRALKGDQIHFDGQVMCVADIYDALTASDRPYKKALPREAAEKILRQEAAQGKLLPELVDLFFEKQCYRIAE